MAEISTPTTPRQYAVFISYRHADNLEMGRKWANWLHEALESYEVPPDLVGKTSLRGDKVPASLYPVFRDEAELPADADLSTNIRRALENSGLLVVLCSPRAVQSKFVADEIRYFKEQGRSDRMLALMIDGEPNASDDPAKVEMFGAGAECFPEPLRFGVAVEGDPTNIDWSARTEPIAADVRPGGRCEQGWTTAAAYREQLVKVGKLTARQIASAVTEYNERLELAKLKIIAGALGLPLGELTQREKAFQLAKAKHKAKVLRRWLAVVIILALCAIVGGIFSMVQKQRAENMLWTASYSDHEAATAAMTDSQHAKGLAYFERSLRYMPRNSGALAASAACAIGSNAPAWRTRFVQPFDGPVLRITISEDGRLLAVLTENRSAATKVFELHLIELSSGKEIYKTAVAEGERTLRFTPDGRHIITDWDIIEVATGKVLTKSIFGTERAISVSPDGHYLTTLEGHVMRIFGLADRKEISRQAYEHPLYFTTFSSNSQRLALSLDDGSIVMLETATEKQVFAVKLDAPADSIDFSPDGALICVRGEDKALSVLDATTGRKVWTSPAKSQVSMASFSADSHHIAIGFSNGDIADGKIQVVEIANNKTVFEADWFSNNKDEGFVQFSPDGIYLIESGRFSSGNVYNWIKGEKAENISVQGSPLQRSFSPDGRYLATAAYDNEVSLFELDRQQAVYTVEFTSRIQVVSFSPDERYLAVACGDIAEPGALHLLEPAAGKELNKLYLQGAVNAITFSPDGEHVGVGSGDVDGGSSEMSVFKPHNGQLISQAVTQGAAAAVHFSPDGRYLAAGSGSKRQPGGIKVMDPFTGKEIHSMKISGNVKSVEFSPDGRRLLAGSASQYGDDGSVYVLEVPSGKQVFQRNFPGNVNAVSFGPNNGLIAAGTGAFCKCGVLRVMRALDGHEIHQTVFAGYNGPENPQPNAGFTTTDMIGLTASSIEEYTGKPVSPSDIGGGVEALCFSSDGNFLVAAGRDRTARVIELTTGKEVCRTKFDNSVYAAKFSPDGKFFATGSGNFKADKGHVHVMEAATGQIVSQAIFSNGVISISFSPDGRFIAAGSDDQTSAVIEAATGKVISRNSFGSGVNAVAFSPDGRHLAAGGSDSTASIIDCGWLSPSEEVIPAWSAALRVQAGQQFRKDAKITHLTTADLMAAQTEIRNFIQAPPASASRWQHAVLTWAAKDPQSRTTSPWSGELFRMAAGRWFMQAKIGGLELLTVGRGGASITSTADQSPWHPLEPVSLARMEPLANDETDATLREFMLIRPLFLARLTLKRLREADEKLYDRNTLAEYATWAARIMHEELHLDAEASEAVTFALERTPPERQQDLLKLKSELEKP